MQSNYDRWLGGWSGRKWLLPGWVTVYGQVNHLGTVYNQPPRSTQPSIPQGYINRVPACLAGVKVGRIHLCRVADKTV